MIKTIMLKLGFVDIKDVEHQVDKIIHKYDNKAPSEKFKDGRKNLIFYKERFLMDEFNRDLNDLKIILKYNFQSKEKQ